MTGCVISGWKEPPSCPRPCPHRCSTRSLPVSPTIPIRSTALRAGAPAGRHPARVLAAHPLRGRSRAAPGEHVGRGRQHHRPRAAHAPRADVRRGTGGLPGAGHARRDPPDHTRLRRLVSKAFTPRAVEALRPASPAWSTRCSTRPPARTTFDLVDALAFPLPFAVIGEMLGTPPGRPRTHQAAERHRGPLARARQRPGHGPRPSSRPTPS